MRRKPAIVSIAVIGVGGLAVFMWFQASRRPRVGDLAFDSPKAVPASQRTGGNTAPAPHLDGVAKSFISNDLSKLETRFDDDTKLAQIRAAMLGILPKAADGATLIIDRVFKYGAVRPSVSPDGQYIVFTGYEDGKTSNLYLYSVATGTYRNLTESASQLSPHIGQGTFSPDGKRILFSGFPDTGLWAISVDGGTPELVLDRRDIISARWAPDGQEVLYTAVNIATRQSTSEVYSLSEHRVVRTIGGGDPNSTIVEPCMSPDGGSLAYVKVSGKGQTQQRSLVIEDLTSGSTTLLPFQGHGVQTPVFSPDGKRIAYRGGNYAWGEIYVYSVADGTETSVTKGSGTSPCWAGSDAIVFGSSRDTGRSQIYRINLPTAERK
jgi:Tol biopolymer transport system component